MNGKFLWEKGIPKKDGEYLCKAGRNMGNACNLLLTWRDHPKTLDELLPDEPGWFSFSSEWGWCPFEQKNVIAWSEIPHCNFIKKGG